MKHSTRYHLLSSFGLFFLISFFLIVFNFNSIEIILIAIGIFIGTFFLDIDHLIFWFFLKPSLEESRLARTALEKKDFKSILKLISLTKKKHHNLIFHHYFFQVILVIFSLFIFTSTNSSFTASLLLSINLHLIIDEIIDYKNDQKYLQRWLFARESKQLPLKFLKRYIIIFVVFFFLLTFIFIKNKL